MTTIYVKYPHKDAIKEVHTTGDRPKIALQKFLNIKGHSDDSKNIKQVDSGYQVRIGEMIYLAY